MTGACRAAAPTPATLEDAVVAVLLVAGRELAHEPRACASSPSTSREILLPHLTFSGGDRFLARRVARARTLPRAVAGRPWRTPRGRVDRPPRSQPSGSRRRRRCRSTTRTRSAPTSREFIVPAIRPASSSSDRRPSSPATLRRRDSPMAVTNEELIGRAELDDVDAILAVTNHDVDAVVHTRDGDERRDLHVGLRAEPHGRCTSSTRRRRRRSGTPTTSPGTPTSTRRRSSSPTRRSRTTATVRWT